MSSLPQVQLVRFSEPMRAGAVPADTRGWYIFANPNERYLITPRGGIRKRISKRAINVATTSAIVGGLLAGAVGVATSPSVGWVVTRLVVYAILFGLVISVLAWLALRAAGVVVLSSRTGKNPSVYLRVDPGDALAWRLCHVTESVIRTTAWQRGTVDPSRQVAFISWSAVGRALSATERLGDARRATAHASLAGLADEVLAKLAQEVEALEQVYLNLGRVLLAARAIDAQHVAAEQRRRDHIAQKREEAELRQKLLGSTAAVELDDSFAEVDRSEGAAAESHAIALLLAESEELLRENS